MELKWKIWFEKNGKPVIGKGGAKILESIDKEGSIARAAKKLGMSYRFVWNYINRLENVLGEKVIIRERGGKFGGGSRLTKLGKDLLEKYKRVEKKLEESKSSIIVKGKIKRINDEIEIIIPSRSIPSVNLKEGDEIEVSLFIF